MYSTNTSDHWATAILYRWKWQVTIEEQLYSTDESGKWQLKNSYTLQMKVASDNWKNSYTLQMKVASDNWKTAILYRWKWQVITEKQLYSTDESGKWQMKNSYTVQMKVASDNWETAIQMKVASDNWERAILYRWKWQVITEKQLYSTDESGKWQLEKQLYSTDESGKCQLKNRYTLQMKVASDNRGTALQMKMAKEKQLFARTLQMTVANEEQLFTCTLWILPPNTEKVCTIATSANWHVD